MNNNKFIIIILTLVFLLTLPIQSIVSAQDAEPTQFHMGIGLELLGKIPHFVGDMRWDFLGGRAGIGSSGSVITLFAEGVFYPLALGKGRSSFQPYVSAGAVVFNAEIVSLTGLLGRGGVMFNLKEMTGFPLEIYIGAHYLNVGSIGPLTLGGIGTHAGIRWAF